MKLKECKYVRCKYYILIHPLVEPKFRTKLLHWISQLCFHNGLQRETFHKSVDYFDRFMATQLDVSPHRLQLVALMCHVIAVKIEENIETKFRDYATLCCNAFSEKEMRQTELSILFHLKFYLNPLTSYHFLCRLYPYDDDDFQTAIALIDTCLIDICSLQYSYACIAESSLALVTGRVTVWTACIQWLSSILETLTRQETNMTFQSIVIPARDCIETTSEYMTIVNDDCLTIDC